MLIYLIENTINGKKYVGQTSLTAEERWKTHVYQSRCGDSAHRRAPLYYAIRKHGVNSFTISVLDTAQSQEELNQKEIDYIRAYRTMEKTFGYNRSEGGGRPVVTAESRSKAAASNRGKKRTIETRLKISNAVKGNQNFLGHKHSEETIQKMSATHKERCRIHGGSRLGLKSSPEHVEKIRVANTGKHRSEETKKKISYSKTNPSAKTRQRLRNSHLGKKQSPETIKKRMDAIFLGTVAWG